MEDRNGLQIRYKNMTKTANIILIVGFSFVLIAPWVFTRCSGLTSFIGTGDIGDTIGGTTAPIIGLISAFLVFYAFKAQIDANRTILNQFDKQEKENNLNKNFSNVFALISRLETEINSFNINYYNPEGGYRPAFGAQSQVYVLNLKGAPAIEHALKGIISAIIPRNLSHKQILGNPSLAEIFFMLEFFQECIQKINTTDLAPSDKSLSLFLLKQSFMSKIEPAFLQEIDKNRNTAMLKKNLFVKKRDSIKKLLDVN